MNTQQAYEAIRAWFTRPEAEFGGVMVDELDDDGEACGESILCVYRGGGDPESTLRCAVGCLIPDDLYRVDFENKTAQAVIEMSDELWRIFAGVDGQFLLDAQLEHDKLAAQNINPDTEGHADADVGDFVDVLDALAGARGLAVVA